MVWRMWLQANCALPQRRRRRGWIVFECFTRNILVDVMVEAGRNRSLAGRRLCA
jgi:hypothetical protein